jgi:hypothetical protein
MKKTAHYRRAIWTDNSKKLSKILKSCLGTVPSSTAHLFNVDDDLDCVVAASTTSSEPIFLQLVTYEAGAPAPVIAANVTSSGLLRADTANAPQGKEYIRSQLFCVVGGNDVVWTSHNTPLREGAISSLLIKLVESLSTDASDAMFGLQAQLDREAFKKAFKKGIAEIDLGLGDFQSALEELVNEGKIPGMGALGALIAKSPTVDEIRAAANLRGKLVLKAGRKWDKPDVRALLEKMALSVFAGHEDEFVIVTKDGMRLTKRKMSVHKDYDVQGTKQILSRGDVSLKLARIFSELKKAGLVEGN